MIWQTLTFKSSVRASLVAQRLKWLPPMLETLVQSLGREDPLEKEMATHYSILAHWRRSSRKPTRRPRHLEMWAFFPAWPGEQSRVLSPNWRGGLTPFRPLRYNLNQIPSDYTVKVTNIQGIRFDTQSAWRTMDGCSWHCTGGSDQDHAQEKNAIMQNGCLRRHYK